jgi:hippurate hydrolase
VNRIADYAEDMSMAALDASATRIAVRPPRNGGFVAERLREFGITDIHEGTPNHRGYHRRVGEGPTIGLRRQPRSDTMDYASKHDGARCTPAGC